MVGPRADPLLGRVLSHRYKLEKKLGEGGMGLVYRADDLVLGRQVAIKVLPAELRKRQELIIRFRHEAIAASAIRHENIIDIFDFIEDDDLTCIVMEYLRGDMLANALRSGPLRWERARSIFDQVAKALRAVHSHGQRIVHRDMKPENIFLTKLSDGS